MIMRCSCEHEFQDRLYGKGMRVFNQIKRSASHSNHARCSVCGVVKPISENKAEPIKPNGNKKQ